MAALTFSSSTASLNLTAASGSAVDVASAVGTAVGVDVAGWLAQAESESAIMMASEAHISFFIKIIPLT
ncbi:hypothetical protein SDC9_185199 [bioreactor metagenome]|uniref:Uncharacterized protein n=1 Tax=bioreactor metagenome TaxID=1076179 RepID=A0A645HHK4_9ZZZZ